MRKIKNRKCINCKSRTTYIHKSGCEQWHKHNDGYMCSKCHNRLINTPNFRKNNPEYINNWRKKHPIRYKRMNKKYARSWNDKCITFKGVRIHIGKIVRKGICEQCNKKIGDEYTNCFGIIDTIKGTDIHHIKYHKNDPLRDTIELCDPCHMRERCK